MVFREQFKLKTIPSYSLLNTKRRKDVECKCSDRKINFVNNTFNYLWFIFQKIFVLSLILGICAAATIKNVDEIKAPVAVAEEKDLKTAETSFRQFGHGGYGGFPGGFGGESQKIKII